MDRQVDQLPPRLNPEARANPTGWVVANAKFLKVMNPESPHYGKFFDYITRDGVPVCGNFYEMARLARLLDGVVHPRPKGLAVIPWIDNGSA